MSTNLNEVTIQGQTNLEAFLICEFWTSRKPSLELWFGFADCKRWRFRQVNNSNSLIDAYFVEKRFFSLQLALLMSYPSIKTNLSHGVHIHLIWWCKSRFQVGLGLPLVSSWYPFVLQVSFSLNSVSSITFVIKVESHSKVSFFFCLSGKYCSLVAWFMKIVESL